MHVGCEPGICARLREVVLCLLDWSSKEAKREKYLPCSAMWELGYQWIAHLSWWCMFALSLMITCLLFLSFHSCTLLCSSLSYGWAYSSGTPSSLIIQDKKKGHVMRPEYAFIYYSLIFWLDHIPCLCGIPWVQFVCGLNMGKACSCNVVDNLFFLATFKAQLNFALNSSVQISIVHHHSLYWSLRHAGHWTCLNIQ